MDSSQFKQALGVYHDCQQRMFENRTNEVNEFMAMLAKSDEGKEHLHPRALYQHIYSAPALAQPQPQPQPTFKELWKQACKLEKVPFAQKGTEEYTRVLARFRLLNA